LIAAGLALLGSGGAVAASGGSGSLCTGTYGGTPRVGAPLRFGVDPGPAGSAGGVQLPAKPDNLAKDVAAVRQLHPRGRILVVRLNRLFWSSGSAGIRAFQRLTRRYGRAGLEVELQVRYHPSSSENGDLPAWRSWVRRNPASDAAFFQYLGARGGRKFRRALGFVGLDFYPGSFYPPTMAGTSYRAATVQALGTLRDCYLPEARIGMRTPLWITENRVPTGATESNAAQASALEQLVQAVRAYSGTFHVTDYRWFNLRDSSSSATGSLPGVSDTFASDGLLNDSTRLSPRSGCTGA
jgi:hypothetical protein